MRYLNQILYIAQASVYTCTGGLTVAWSWVGVLHSSNEPGELSQWLCHDDSTINIVLDIIIIIIIIIIIAAC